MGLFLFRRVCKTNGLAPPDLCKSLLSLLKGRRLADSVFSEKQVPVASEGGMLLSEMKAIAVAERNVLPHAMRAFVERHGRPFFSFTHRPRAGVGIARAYFFFAFRKDECRINFSSRWLPIETGLVGAVFGDFIRVYDCFFARKKEKTFVFFFAA
uniref:Uncharacterized protein n=1 Tax=Trypanosoma vivax (strain Y486) TaxID=1055687 RepID=G0TT12_TRYVY|nr:conserved hypothetical protein, in T. vivax [Trypanosoma vivax Y486]